MDDNPPREEERLPRPQGVRGTRAGAAAQRKRKAYQQYIFLRDQDLGIYTDPSEIPFRRPDGSTRAVVRRPETAPFQAVEEQSEVIVIDEQESEEGLELVPETPPPSTSSGEDSCSITSTRSFVIELFNSEAFTDSKTFVDSFSFTTIRHSGSKDSAEGSASWSYRACASSAIVYSIFVKCAKVTEAPRVIDFRSLQTEVLDFEGVKVKLTEPAFEKFSFALSLDFHGVLDRYHNKSTSWTDPRPEFPSECLTALRDLHSLVPRYGGLFFVCSYCHHEDTKKHVVETTVNSCDTLFTQIGETPLCLIFITRKATGPLGKRSVLEKLSKEIGFPIIHVDDSADVCDELAGSQHVVPLHIAIRKRSRGGRGQRTIFPSAPVPSFDSFPECAGAIRGQVQKWFPDA
ncbi:ABCG2 [Symbiodinium sp. CCMP2592]|nr:ABCG2 [Symbiodinium sp. CCMP2592]